MLAVASLLLIQSSIQVRLVTDEPVEALRILDKRDNHQPIAENDWKNLFQTDGYQRLKARELGMKREFTEEAFKTFMLSDDLLARREPLAAQLHAWQKIDLAKAAERSLSYLPEGSTLKAKVYFLIKPRPNSFVWDTDTDPAVMLYLDPKQSTADLEMTIAHEFHHIGYESRSPSAEYKAWYEKQPAAKKTAFTWLRAFGEGFAVLASAGSLEAEPYGPMPKDVKEAWAKGSSRVPEDMKALADFFLQTLQGKLTEEQAETRAREYYGMVGPWYTVGYHLAATIERQLGRKRLLECYLDPRLLLPTYNEAAKRSGGPVWPDELVSAFGP